VYLLGAYVNVKEEYEKMYVDIGFERSGLFKCLSKIRNYESVAYIGSSIHICPSFYFRNVAYIDNSCLALDFFSDLSKVLEYVESRKTYSGLPHIEYYDINYETGLDEHKQKYDLVICIYAPRSLGPAVSLSRINGNIIYLPMPSDNDLATENRVKIAGCVKFNKRGYYCDRTAMVGKPKKIRSSKQVFKEVNEYYLLERLT